MKAMDILKKEHALITKFLNNLQGGLNHLEECRLDGPPAEYFQKVFTFALDFADRHHHHKEEYGIYSVSLFTIALSFM